MLCETDVLFGEKRRWEEKRRRSMSTLERVFVCRSEWRREKISLKRLRPVWDQITVVKETRAAALHHTTTVVMVTVLLPLPTVVSVSLGAPRGSKSKLLTHLPPSLSHLRLDAITHTRRLQNNSNDNNRSLMVSRADRCKCYQRKALV